MSICKLVASGIGRYPQFLAGMVHPPAAANLSQTWSKAEKSI